MPAHVSIRLDSFGYRRSGQGQSQTNQAIIQTPRTGVPKMATSFNVNVNDLQFILKQIKIAEESSAAYNAAPKTIL